MSESRSIYDKDMKSPAINKLGVVGTTALKSTSAYNEPIPAIVSNTPEALDLPRPRPLPSLQLLPDEILLQIVNDMPFRGLRAFLHSPSIRLARLAKFRLDELQKEFQSWPGATEETKFFWHKPGIAPWPSIEVVGPMFLGKEFCLVDRGERDEFSFTIDELPPYHEIRTEHLPGDYVMGLSSTFVHRRQASASRLLVFLRQGVCWKVRWSL